MEPASQDPWHLPSGRVSRRRTRLERASAYVPYLPFFVLTVAIPLPANLYVPAGLRLALANYRPVLVALVIGSALLWGIAKNGRRLGTYLRRPVWPRVFGLGLLFPFFYAAALFTKPEFRVAASVQYFLWPIFCFLCVPMMAQKPADLRRLTFVLVAGNLCCLLIPFLLSFSSGPVQLRFQDLFSLGYNNPDYYSQIHQVLFAMSILAIAREAQTRQRLRWLSLRRLSLRAALVVTVWSAWLAEARNVVVFMALTALCYKIVRRSRYPLRRAGALLVISIAVGMLTVPLFESRELDEFSSGRLTIWRDNVEKTLQREGGAKAIMLGPNVLPSFEGRHGYDDMRGQKNHGKFHIDNAYLELLFEAGLIGLFLFLLPIFRIANAAEQRGTQKVVMDPAPAWAISVLVGLGAQSMLIPTMPSFGNPLGPFIPLAFVMALGPVIVKSEFRKNNQAPEFEPHRGK